MQSAWRSGVTDISIGIAVRVIPRGVRGPCCGVIGLQRVLLRETGFLKRAHCPLYIAFVDQQIQVGERAEVFISVCDGGKERALEGKSCDAMAIEVVQQVGKLAADLNAFSEQAQVDAAKVVQRRRWHPGCKRRLQMVIDKRHDVVRYRELNKRMPIYVVLK
jgi:hypothetical protein